MSGNTTDDVKGRSIDEPATADKAKNRHLWLDVFKAVAMPLVALVLGFVFNASLASRQARDNDVRLYTEMMGRREQAETDLRREMFKSILDTFMNKDTKLDSIQLLSQQVLKLELLAYNFHESLDIGPLFKDVRSRIPNDGNEASGELRKRLEKVAQEVIERQLTSLSDTGMVETGYALPEKIDDLEAYLNFGPHTVSDPATEHEDDVPRLCLYMKSSDEERHYRQFKLEIIGINEYRELQVRLYVSQLLNEDQCQQTDLDLVSNREIDSNFWVGLFDFPMIDNTRLTYNERCAVSLRELTPNVLKVSLSYFSGSRASLKDKPYYDEMMLDLLHGHQASVEEKN